MLSLLIRLLVTVFVVIPARVFAGLMKGIGPVIRIAVWILLLPIRLLSLPFRILR
jgi:hypothetical protein